MKFLIEINEKQYNSHIDEENEYVYCTLQDLDEKILETIDSDDIASWIPIGSTEFVNKFYINFLIRYFEND
jgi:hypothetical protein